MQIERYIARESERDAAAWISSGRMAGRRIAFCRKYRLQCSREIRRRGSLFFLAGEPESLV